MLNATRALSELLQLASGGRFTLRVYDGNEQIAVTIPTAFDVVETIGVEREV